MRKRFIPVIFTIAALVPIAACSKTPEPVTPSTPTEEAPPPQVSPVQQAAIDDAEKETGGTGLGIDDEILRLCPAVRPPKFGYDSARVKDEFRNTLVALAQCMNDGALKGRSLLMVGHADPRGEEDYNMALGGRRAESVRGAMESLGVDKGRMDVSSRGELEATGVDEESWAKDRRVDIKLKAN
ncbi:MAG TPA: OmpA family protein [Polyangiaceae bacterium]|jgi:peptidoglycan-associated lipoprotein|nr:MAG: Outer membrane protein P6 precursor [Deltaproteobacteria bacterium ADurb.Bin207]HNS98600.1 OmpA family protein [Polyangiaceae bacterium]HNZ25477.1 OmpA family protein [Polyangiaceae bacterium]HOD25202.1 OmpA family protein [Polyangiaceae bacterium]HOE51792.1 OmpA family protein [Polyangiaceae bacterium]